MDEMAHLMQDDDVDELVVLTLDAAAEDTEADVHLDMDGEEDPPQADAGHH